MMLSQLLRVTINITLKPGLPNKPEAHSHINPATNQTLTAVGLSDNIEILLIVMFGITPQ